MTRLLGYGASAAILDDPETEILIKVLKSKQVRNNEININTFLEKIDPEGRFHMTYYISSQYNLNIPLDVSYRFALFFKKGQDDMLYHIKNSLMHPLDSFALFDNIFRGVIYYHSQGIYHCDLKLTNLVMDDGILKMIDFGNGVMYPHIPMSALFESIYVCWPPESIFISRILSKEQLQTHLYLYEQNPYIKRQTAPYSTFNEELIEALYNYGLSSNPENILINIDTFSLGYCLLNFMTIMKPKLESKFIEALSSLVISMITMNPYRRISLAQAYTSYKQLLETFLVPLSNPRILQLNSSSHM